MTNEEIIKFLQSKQIPQCGDKVYTADEEYEAYQRAIDALDQQPCDDAISRKTLLTNLYQYKISYAGRIQAAILEVEELVEKMPPVTPQQKYGKWIKHPEIETSTPEYLMFYECSECGDKQCFCKSDLHKKRFCNSCGVKMQESEE